MLAGAGLVAFWFAIIFLSYTATCTPLLRWNLDNLTERAAQLARQLHVRGVAGRFENENELSALFEEISSRRVLQVTVRHRVDDTTGANISWAMVTMEDGEAADRVIEATSSLPASIVVERYSREQADASPGAMGGVRQQVAGKFEKTLGDIQKLALNAEVSDSAMSFLRVSLICVFVSYRSTV